MCTPGQSVKAPVAGVITRVAYPYAGNQEYLGLVLQGEWCRCKLFYVKPDSMLIDTWVPEAYIIGTAQDISKKYGAEMLPHVHLEMTVDPALFLKQED